MKSKSGVSCNTTPDIQQSVCFDAHVLKPTQTRLNVIFHKKLPSEKSFIVEANDFLCSLNNSVYL
jgi:hypothetical protein